MGTGRFNGGSGIRNISYKVFNSKSDGEKAMRVDIDNWTKALKSSEKTAIYDYTGESGISYKKTNPILRQDRYKNMSREDMFADMSQRGVDPKIIDAIRSIDKGLSRYTNNTPFLGYRGAGFSLLGLPKTASLSDIKNVINSDTILKDVGHMSISTSKGNQFYGKVLYEVEVPKGKGVGAYLGANGISHYSGEAEFLVSGGTLYKPISVREHTGFGYKYVVRLKIVGREK